MAAISKRVIALTIAGSDSGGGAGLQADLKTFAVLGVHGVCAVACLTAQTPRGVSAIWGCPPRMLRQQLEAVFTGLRPRAVKTGMLYSAANIRLVADFLGALKNPPPLVVDPVMTATSGAALLAPAAAKTLLDRLLPLATLITPNLAEAARLTGEPVQNLEAMRTAARKIHARFGTAVLLKGGHLEDSRRAADVFFDGRVERILTAPRISGMATHGTGCTCSAAICAALARGEKLGVAVETGKETVTRAIRRSYAVNGYPVLNPGG